MARTTTPPPREGTLDPEPGDGQNQTTKLDAQAKKMEWWRSMVKVARQIKSPELKDQFLDSETREQQWV